MTIQEAFERGVDDAKRDRSPIFRPVPFGAEPTVDDPQADDWTDEQRLAYLRGYDSYDPQGG